MKYARGAWARPQLSGIRIISTHGVLLLSQFVLRESHAGDGLDTLKCLLEDIKIRLDAVSARQERLEVLFKQEGQRQRHHWDDICEMKGALEELLRRVPKRICSEGALLYEYVDRERLEALRRLSGGNMNHFALELEKDVYIDEPEELAVKVENRVRTSTRVDYIKEVSTSYEQNIIIKNYSSL